MLTYYPLDCATGTSPLSRLAPLEAILLDVDGTLCDSDPIHYQAYREMLPEVRILFLSLLGNKLCFPIEFAAGHGMIKGATSLYWCIWMKNDSYLCFKWGTFHIGCVWILVLWRKKKRWGIQLYWPNHCYTVPSSKPKSKRRLYWKLGKMPWKNCLGCYQILQCLTDRFQRWGSHYGGILCWIYFGEA